MSVNKVNKTTGDLSLLAGGTLYADNPIGSIIPYGGATAPAGWFICDGTELVRATYPELFAVIGTSFGTPSDNTKFKLPDLREATTKGVGLTGKSNNHYDADGLALGEFIDDRMQDWRGTGKWRMFIPNDSEGWNFITQSSNGDEISGRYGDTTEVKAVGVNYIIKAVSVGVPADFMSAVDSALSNIGTSGITESSALSNIGTSANATQHDVNVAINAVMPSDTSVNNKLVNDSRLKSFGSHEYTGASGDVTFNLSDYGCKVERYYGFRITCLSYGAWGNFEIVGTNNGANDLIKVYIVKDAPTGITIDGVWSGNTLTGIIIKGASTPINAYNIRFEVIG